MRTADRRNCVSGLRWQFLALFLAVTGLLAASASRGQPRATLDSAKGSPPFFHVPGSVDDVRFSPDGRLIAASGYNLAGPARLWDLASQEQLATLSTLHPTQSRAIPLVFYRARVLGFSPDGKLLMTIYYDDLHRRTTVVVWDVEAQRPLRNFPLDKGDGASGWVLPDNNTLVVSSKPAPAAMYDLTSGRCIDRLAGHDDVTSVAVSRDGKQLATYSPVTRDIWIWDLEKRKRLFELRRCPEKDPVFLAFSSDGQYLAAARLRQSPVEVVLWDLKTKKDQSLDCSRKPGPMGEVPPPGSVDAFRFSPDGRYLIVLNRGDLLYSDVRTGKRRAYVEGRIKCEQLYSIDLSPDGKQLAVGENHGVISLWDVPPVDP
jgi:WD40 repeat protein